MQLPLEALPIVHFPILLPATAPARPVGRGRGRSAARLAASLLLLGLVAATALPGAAAADPAPSPPDTLTATIHTATADGSVVDATAYAEPADVHLVARVCDPDATPLAAGEYYFGVFDGSGTLRSGDGLPDRRFRVDAQGWISGTSGSHGTARTICPGNGAAFVSIAIAPFNVDSVAPTDRLWLRVATRASADACVGSGDPSGFGCAAVERTSVSFSIDPAASPTPTPAPTEPPAPSPSGSDGTSPSGAPDGSPSASSSGAPVASAAPSPGGSEAPEGLPSGSPDGTGASPSPSGDASPTVSPSGSGTPGASPTTTPAPDATPGPTQTPPPAATPVRTPPPQSGGNTGTGGAPWTGGQALPSYVPFSIPPGYFVCPGQIITPTGCQPLDADGGDGGAASPTPTWSWGPVPSGAPVFPGTGSSTGGTTDPLAPLGGAPAGAVTRGSVEAAVDILGPFTQPSGVSGTSPASGSPSGAPASGTPSSGTGSAGPGGSPTGGSADTGSSPTGDVAAAGGMAQDGSLPPGPAPTASVTAPSPPALPAVLAIVLLALVGAAVGAVVGWARRGVSRGVTGPARTLVADRTPLAAAVRRVRRGLGREPGAQP